MAKQKLSPLITKYLETYRKNPRSRVFAPLAEAYRKIGLYPEAIKILNDGLKNHPSYLLGYIALANCYYDTDKKDLTYSTLRPFISVNRDNISLQKLYAETCLDLGKDEEALETYKYLLFLNPKDKDINQKIKELEEIFTPLVEIKSKGSPQFDNEKLSSSAVFDDADDWVTVDFTRLRKVQSTLPDKEETDIEKFADTSKQSLPDQWEVKEPARLEQLDEEKIDSQPVVTHTLVDLYIRQGHTDKAKEILEKIQEVAPGDEKTLRMLKELADDKEYTEVEALPVEDIRDKVMSVFDSKVNSLNRTNDQLQVIHQKFNLFLKKLHELKNNTYV